MIKHELPHELLAKMAKTFEERHRVYGDNYLKLGQVMSGLFPDGIELLDEADFVRFHLIVLKVVKLTRYCNNFLEGGHQDSIHDDAVYSAMLESVDQVFSSIYDFDDDREADEPSATVAPEGRLSVKDLRKIGEKANGNSDEKMKTELAQILSGLGKMNPAKAREENIKDFILDLSAARIVDDLVHRMIMSDFNCTNTMKSLMGDMPAEQFASEDEQREMVTGAIVSATDHVRRNKLKLLVSNGMEAADLFVQWIEAGFPYLEGE